MKKSTAWKKAQSAALRLSLLALGAAGVMFGMDANAAIDVTAATTSITTDGTAAITAVGGALIGLAGVAVVYKWVKGAIFG